MNTALHQSLKKIAASFEASENEKVLVQWWGDASDQALLTQFAAELALKNIEVHTLLFDKVHVAESFNGSVDQESTQLPSDHLRNLDFSLQSNVENIIDVCRFAPPALMAHIKDEAKPNFIQFMQGLFGAISSPKNQFIQLRLPSEASAEESSLSLEHYESLWHQLVNVDYGALKLHCQETISQYSAYNTFHVKTGENCLLSFEVSGRPWHSDHGNGDFPAGEVYIAPIEDSANGSFFTPRINWEGGVMENVTLTFEKGLLTTSSHPEILEDLASAPGDALRFAEFGIGLNPNHKDLCGYNLFDEKALGTCHIAIGMNHLFGGQNDSPVHIDFVATNPSIQGK